MIKISIPLQQDFVIETLESTNDFKFVEKKGINLFFETTIEDSEEAIKLAKSTIKGTKTGSVLYFQVSAVNE